MELIVLFFIITLFGCVHSMHNVFTLCLSNIILTSDHGTVIVGLHENHTSASIRWNRVDSVNDVYKPRLVCSEATTLTTAINGTSCYHRSDGHHVLNWTWTTSQNLFAIIVANAIINDDGDGDSCAAFVTYISEILITNNHSTNAVKEPIRWGCAFNCSSLMAVDVLLVCNNNMTKELLMNYTPPDATMRQIECYSTMDNSQQLPWSCICKVNVHPSEHVTGFANNSLSVTSDILKISVYSRPEDLYWLLWLLVVPVGVPIWIVKKVWWVQLKEKIMCMKNHSVQTPYPPPTQEPAEVNVIRTAEPSVSCTSADGGPRKKVNGIPADEQSPCTPPTQKPAEVNVTSAEPSVPCTSSDGGPTQTVNGIPADEPHLYSLLPDEVEYNRSSESSHAEPPGTGVGFPSDFTQPTPEAGDLKGVGHQIALQDHDIINNEQDHLTGGHDEMDNIDSGHGTLTLTGSTEESSPFLLRSTH